MDEGGRVYFESGLDNSGLRKGAEDAKRTLHGIGDSASAEGERIDAAFRKAGEAVAAVFAVSQIKSFITQVAQVRGEFQQLEIAFRTMIGDERQANDLMSQLIKTAAQTPFGMTDLASGAKQLLAFGVQAEEVNETLIRLGDISAGLSIPLGDLVYLYGTTMTQGRLFTQDLRQFMGRGIPLAEELAKQFGVTKDKVSELVTEGKVGFEEVRKAIVSLTDDGGKFGGLMEAQSKSITGQLSNIEDSITQMFNDIGKQTEGVINDALDIASSLIEHWREVGKVLTVVISAYGAYKAAVLAVAAAHKIAAIWGEVSAFLSLTRSITSAKDAMLLLNMATKANPMGLVLSAVAAAATAFALFRKQSDEAADAIRRQQEAIKEFDDRVGREAAAMTVRYNSLREEYGKLADEHSKTEWIEANRSAFDSLGISVGDVVTAENIFVNNTDTMLRAFQRRAEAAAWQDKVQQAYAERTSRVIELERRQAEIYAGAVVGGTGHSATSGDERINSAGQWVYTEQGAEKARKALMDNDAILKRLDKQIDTYTEKVRISADAYSESLKEAGSVTVPELTDKENRKLEKERIRAAREAQKAADKAAEAGYDNRRIKERRALEEREAEIEIRQAAIEGQKEGFDRQIAEAELEYDRLMLVNERRQQEMLDALRDERVAEERAKNPDMAKEREVAIRESVTVADLTPTQKSQLEAYAEYAAELRRRKNSEALEGMLSDVLTYEQRRNGIEQDYAERRRQMYTEGDEAKGLRPGVTQGNLDELSRQRDEDLKAVDEQFAQREATYNAWCDRISEMTLEQLNRTLEDAKAALDAAEKDGASGQELAAARAKVNRARQAVSEANAENVTSPGRRSVKEWEDLYKTLNECEREFESLGDTIGGVIGEVVESAGEVMTSTLKIIDGIKQLATSSAKGISETSEVAGKALSKVEKASVILTIITSALSVAMKVAEAFDRDKRLQQSIDTLGDEIEALQWELDNRDIARMRESYGSFLDTVREEYETELLLARVQKLRASESSRSFLEETARLKEGRLGNERVSEAAGKVAEAYRKVSYTADKALGEERYQETIDGLRNIAEQQTLIYEQRRQEEEKKKSDQSVIDEYDRQIEELGEKAVRDINGLVEDIVGGSSSDIAKQLGDSFIEAFAAGEDAAEAWGAKVNDIVADVMRRMLVQKYLEEPLGVVFDKYKDRWFSEEQFSIQRVIGSMEAFAADLNGVGEDFAAIWESLPESVRNMFTSSDAAMREASQGGIASASQDSIDELNGRMTAVQGHTYSIAESARVLQQNSGEILRSVLAIEAHASRLDAMEGSLRSVRETLNDITVRGIRINGIRQ